MGLRAIFLTIFIYIEYKENNPSFLRSGFMKTDKIVFLFFLLARSNVFGKNPKNETIIKFGVALVCLNYFNQHLILLRRFFNIHVHVCYKSKLFYVFRRNDMAIIIVVLIKCYIHNMIV